MKTIPLKIVMVKVQGQELELNYKTQIETIMRTPPNPQAGADFEEVRKSVRVLDALENATGDTLTLEDADFEHMKKRIENARYKFIDRAVQTFKEDVCTPLE